MPRTLMPAAAIVLALAAATVAPAQQPAGSDSTAPAAKPAPATRPATSQPAAGDVAGREKWFAELLTDAVLAGSYTMGNGPPRQDRYTITRAVKGEGDLWKITSRVEYKGFGVPVEISIPVVWAGDTPVMQLTKYTIPGMGTFSCRILFYGDQYAGAWDAGDHGGMMWGKVERKK